MNRRGERVLRAGFGVTCILQSNIPTALRDASKKKLDEMEKMNTYRKYPSDPPTPWCSTLHVVHKKNTSPEVDVWITIVPKDLNKELLHEYHPTTAPTAALEQVSTRTNGKVFFTVLDANMGYFQIELTDASQISRLLKTPFGRYKYLRLPMGVSSAPEIY